MGGEGPWVSQSAVSLLLFAPNLAPAAKPPSGFSMPVLAKKQDDAPRRAARGRKQGPKASQTLGPTLQEGKRHLQSGWESPSQPHRRGHLCARHPTPAPRSLTPFASRQGALHNRPCPWPRAVLRNLESFHPSWHSCPPALANTGSGSWDGTRGRLGRGSGHGGSVGGRALSVQPWLGPGGGAALVLAGLGGSTAGRVAPGLGCCGSHIPATRAGFPCSLISPSKLYSVAAPAFLPRVANGSGCLRTYPRHKLPQPRASHRSKGWARVSSPSLRG